MKPLLSLRQLTLRYTAAIFAIFAALACLTYFLFYDFARQQEHESLVHELQLKAQDIAFLVDFYRNIVEQIAGEQRALDLVTFGSAIEAQNWATSKQKLMPQNIGLALVDREGKVLGNPLALRVGERCLSDLSAHIAGTAAPQPPVHTLAEGLEHFDLIANIHDETGIAGAVFASFSLSILQTRLEGMANDGLQVALYSGDGTLLARAGRVDPQTAMPAQVIPVNNTDWAFRATAQQRDYSPLWSRLAIAGAVIMLLTVAVMYLFARRLSRIFGFDLQAIERLLESVKDNRVQQMPCAASRLRETCNIMSSIGTLAGDIAQHQNRLLLDSTTDELTGLYNRRAFRQKAEKCFALTRRGVKVSIVALDMDYLKTINDRFGHAVGDQLLQALAECLRENTRGTDTVARLGGDEFLVMMVQCAPDSIVGWFDKLCSAFATRQRDIVPSGSEDLTHCSLSAGLSEVSPDDQDIEAAIGRADDALYNAKGAGRGRISRWDDEPDMK